MVTIRLKQDTLNEENKKFEQIPLERSLFLNSIPKSGSHLLRNIFRMFVPLEDHYADQFVQFANLKKHVEAFNPNRNLLSWGHLLFSDISALEASVPRKLILVRDPHSWVLARARFFLSDEFGDEKVIVKNENLPVDSLINLMIFGIHKSSLSMQEMFTYMGVAWMNCGDSKLVRYEDLIKAIKNLDSDESETFFMDLFAAAGLPKVPDDWRERVRIGSDRKQSSTASEKLTGRADLVPKVLGDEHKRLIEYAAPGLRKFLGYE
ncbi:hypothetical protein GCM10009127_27850 [Alteraurantiacibacter aestuarii]|uniref:Sulfotransferase domain-containing protein n=1 Tax=Alteraurantiacibacter aestuarii TaxID=650004 RepID=A0A844ZM46_9SPHN|nr:hypothetical protein [Alteraurantiacibacter aestuarii]MXO88895.1 hypothetical protein [Alteraurantiacibacter aestuarii]